MIIGGPSETISIAPLAGEDLDGSCRFDMNLPDEQLTNIHEAPPPNQPKYTEVAALVVYERGDSAKLFNDDKIQNMAATLHMATVFAHQCDAKSRSDIQDNATKGPGRALLAALTQYATDTGHPEIASTKLVLSGFSAAGVLSVSMAKAYPDRVLTMIPYATGSAWTNVDDIAVTQAMAAIPTLILANAYDSQSGNQRSLRLFQRGWSQGAIWAFGVQNHTDHCCTLSVRDLMIPWVSAIVPQPIPAATAGAAGFSPVQLNSFALPAVPSVRFTTYTDGWPDAQGENDIWIPHASVLPSTDGGPSAGWLPDATTAEAWYKWVTSPGTN